MTGVGGLSLQEAIYHQTLALTKAEKGSSLEDGIELDTRLADSSW